MLEMWMCQREFVNCINFSFLGKIKVLSLKGKNSRGCKKFYLLLNFHPGATQGSRLLNEMCDVKVRRGRRK